MQDTHDLYSIRADLKINCVPLNDLVAVAWADVVAGWGSFWLLRQLLERLRHDVYVTVGLFDSPRLSAVKPDAFKVSLCCGCKSVFSHGFLTFFS